MSIKSTTTITRQTAVNRIKKIIALIRARDYKAIDNATSELDRDECDLVDFVEQENDVLFCKPHQYKRIQNWSDGMLEYQMDKPYYRLSIFSNYIIGDDQ